MDAALPPVLLTPALAAAALYAGLMGLLIYALSLNVSLNRRRGGVSLGDGGKPALQSAIRAHANLVENAPIILLMMTLMAIAGAPAVAVHVIGLMLLIGRLSHAFAFVREGAGMIWRMIGASLTLVAGFLAAAGLVGHALAVL